MHITHCITQSRALTFPRVARKFKINLQNRIHSLKLSKDRRKQTFERKILRGTSGPKRDKNDVWRELHNEQLHNFYRLTLSDLNLFKEIKKKNLQHNPTTEKQIDISFFFFHLIIVHAISETAKLYRRRSKLWFNNAKWNYQEFYSIYRSRGVRKLEIQVAITRSEMVK